VHGGDEEDANEKLGDEHGLVGLQLGGRCSRKKSVLDFMSVLSFPASTRSHKPPPPITSSQVFQSFRSSPSLFARCAAAPSSLLIFVLSSSSYLAGNPISSPQLHHLSTPADVCSDIGLFYCLQPRFAPCLHSLRRFIRRILWESNLQLTLPLSESHR
jgi:hypothetical protein